MLRTTKWKLEKPKVKVVFRLQFHATNIPQSGWEKLYISFIPTESGKIIAKTSKANVRNGTCKWPDPIYETTRLLVDSRNKRYDDNLYKLVVGMGTSRSSILGEAIINLADYADASNPSVIALPLHGSDNGTILHVTVQLLTAKTGFREFEQQFDKGLQNSSILNREVEPSIATSSSSESQISDDHGNKVNTKTHFGSESKELISAVREIGTHEESLDSSVRCDGSSNTSETYYADKIDPSSIHEPNSLRSMASGDLNEPPHGQGLPIEKAERSDLQEWSSDYSMNNDLAIAHEENHRLRGILEMAESSIFELKMELSALHSYANEMGIETQKIAQHLTAEISSGQKLGRDIMVLRSECSKFNDELEQLKEIKSSSEFIGRTQDRADCHQLKCVNGLLLVEDRIRELQGKIHIGFHESDLSFIHSDLEVLLSIVQDLEKGTFEALPLQHEIQEFRSTRAFDLVEGKILILSSQLDEAKAERENLVRKMDEMECYYEALVQELEENQKQILGQFQSLRYEHSTCAYTISTCKAETESLRHDMNDQVIRFTKERHALGCVNEELEKRVMTAESLVQELQENQEQILGEFQSLRNEHSTCADTIKTCKAETESVRHDINDRISKFAKERHDLYCVNEELEKRVTTAEALVQELQENQEQILGEFQSLKNEHLTCAETISTCKAENELIRHDMNDQILEFAKERHTLSCVNEELEKRVATAESALKRARLNYSIAVTQLQKDLDTLSFQVLSMFETNQTLIKDTFSESSKPFSQRYPNMIENFQKSDDTLVLCEKQLLGSEVHSNDELCEIPCTNLYLDVYSGTLEETLFEASKKANEMKEQIKQYAQKLELSNQSRDILFGRLQTADEQIAQINDAQLQNQKLEASLESVLRENFLLMEKITECEALLMDYRVYKSKYEVVSAEKLELENLLEVQGLDSGNLRKDLSITKEELETLKARFLELEKSKESMQKLLDFLQEKFGNLLASCDKQLGEHFSFNYSSFQDTGIRDITCVITKLEELHNYTGEKIEDLKKERDIARSEIDGMRTKFTHDMRNMAAKVDSSNTIVEKLQLQLESVAKKFKNSLEMKESYMQHTDGLLTYLSSLELELHKLSSKDGNFVLEILGSDSMADEFESCKSPICELNQEKQDFLMPIENKEETTIREELEMENIRVVLKAMLDEHYDQYVVLREKCSELTDELSEQVLKTEEFKNLVKLKDSEKREPEGPSESLRIAFMKEQCETTVQELKQELSVSKRHGEEILLKLQDVLDETESRKKSEASYLKKIEELSFKNVGLEAELQSIQAELECAFLNLECCKEEKEKIVASIQECEEEKLKIAFELSLFQEHLSRKEEKGVGMDSSANGNASTAQIFELEGMKTENSILSMTNSGSSFQDLRRKLLQLHKANEELGGMYPNFKDFSEDGNALERVLALEIELAEALMTKKNSSIQFQSSFLKQHGDEEAIFKSFRDINEVIKDTLEIKSKYANMDTELKEMHERYSQLSLQFAEVEGERQKLLMTLKNSRSPRNLVRSSPEP
ncbi:putative WEB family protein At1g65010, chloroplastic [Cynara cardunculus var. scolymus]|uniref:putative WEB family protein At1g65010, chloroplastic n=1 Tax=Cynara cardunculus var. scolymus TaxID=59895 RepID=UPI000D62FCCB|nr:putative WEB family protein At1g65010, chloroplastic [Cynara cardunculus var. scolymus]